MKLKDNVNTIAISKKSFLAILLFTILALFLIYIRYLVLILILAFILSSFVKYFANLLEYKYRISYKYGVITIFVSLLLMIIGGIILLFPLILKESYGFIEFINTMLKSLSSGSINIGLPIEGINLSQFNNLIPNLGQLTISILSSIGGIITYLILIIVLSFYITIDSTGLISLIKIFCINELNKSKVPGIIEKLQYHIGKWTFVEVSISFIMTIFIYTVLSILEFKYSVILSVIAGASQLIPILGPVLIYIIIIFIAFLQSSILGIITISLIVAIQLIKQFLILPIIFKSLNIINPLLVVFSLIIGGVLMGTLGVLLAMPVVSLSKIIYKDIFNYDK